MKLTKTQYQHALSPRYRSQSLDNLRDADRIIDRCRKDFESSGYVIVVKTGSSTKPNSATTYPGRLELPTHWGAMPVPTKAALIAHERIHLRQQVEVGKLAFLARYVRPRDRLVWEIQGYIEQARVHRRLGGIPEGYVGRVAEALAADYGPWLVLSKAYVRDVSVELLLTAIARGD